MIPHAKLTEGWDSLESGLVLIAESLTGEAAAAVQESINVARELRKVSEEAVQELSGAVAAASGRFDCRHSTAPEASPVANCPTCAGACRCGPCSAAHRVERAIVRVMERR